MIVEILLAVITLLILIALLAAAFIGRKIYSIISRFLPPGVLRSSLPEEETSSGLNTLFPTKSFRYKLMWVKKCFDSGVAITSLPSKILVVVGFAGVMAGYPPHVIILYGIAYGFFCLILGWIFLQYFYEAEQEVSNQYNLFVKEMRSK